MLIVEKLEQLVQAQMEAIKGIKIDKVVVWDGGQNGAEGKNATAGFLSGLANSLPPIHDLAKTAGIDLPDYLGRVADDGKDASEAAPAPKASATEQKKKSE